MNEKRDPRPLAGGAGAGDDQARMLVEPNFRSYERERKDSWWWSRVVALTTELRCSSVGANHPNRPHILHELASMGLTEATAILALKSKGRRR